MRSAGLTKGATHVDSTLGQNSCEETYALMEVLECSHGLLCREQNRWLKAQSGGWELRQESLLLVPATSCMSSFQPSCNLFQGRLFWSVWKPHCLAPGNLPEPKTTPYISLNVFFFPLQPNEICPCQSPKHHTLPEVFNPPTFMVCFCSDGARRPAN